MKTSPDSWPPIPGKPHSKREIAQQAGHPRGEELTNRLRALPGFDDPLSCRGADAVARDDLVERCGKDRDVVTSVAGSLNGSRTDPPLSPARFRASTT